MPKVMIVDDDRTMVSLLKILLEMDGFEVVNVTHGRDFLPKVREEKPDIVLLDVFLTNMDGKELVAEVRKSEDLSDLKVVMTSGMELAEQCANAGADAFLLKPYTPEQLMKVLQDNLENFEGNVMPSATQGES
ncbi:MAG: response regulator [Anaerolineales bacterium]|jgi:CheY-like chemotaxis protein